MSPKKIQLVFLLGICAITLHFSIRLGIDTSRYFSLQNQTQAQIKEWEIVKIKDLFAIKAKYSFKAKEKIWEDQFTLSAPYYLNEGAALSALKQKAKEPWHVWFKAKNPQISALEKIYPVGLLIRSLICYAVSIYFFCLYKRLSVV